METIKAKCSSCGGKGLYSGMCEAEDEAVICLTCGGTGCEEIRYTPYNGRVKTNRYKRIKHSGGRLIIFNSPNKGKHMTYKEFTQLIKEK